MMSLFLLFFSFEGFPKTDSASGKPAKGIGLVCLTAGKLFLAIILL